MREKCMNFMQVESSDYPLTEKADMQLRRAVSLDEGIQILDIDLPDQVVQDEACGFTLFDSLSHKPVMEMTAAGLHRKRLHLYNHVGTELIINDLSILHNSSSFAIIFNCNSHQCEFYKLDEHEFELKQTCNV